MKKIDLILKKNSLQKKTMYLARFSVVKLTIV